MTEKKKRVYADKDRQWGRINNAKHRANGYCKINLWCPVEAREEVERLVRYHRENRIKKENSYYHRIEVLGAIE